MWRNNPTSSVMFLSGQCGLQGCDSLVWESMRNSFQSGVRVLLATALVLSLAPPAGARKHPGDLTQILDQMKEASKNLKTVYAVLQYTKFTVLVNDTSTESGLFYFRKGKTPEIRLDIQKPDTKILLLKKNRGEFYLPKIKQIQEYDLSQKSDAMQQILLLGFGADPWDLKKSYDVKYLREEDLEGDTNVLLELVPRKSASSQFTKIQMWISEESWLPTQQKFFQPDGDYLLVRYSSVKKNRDLANSIFELNAPSDAKIVKMN